jgi:ribosomal protein S18 acetylase RimI-like enzyme
MSVSSQPFPFRPPSIPADVTPPVQLVELTSLGPEALEGLWLEERRYWNEWLNWDSEPATALVRAAVQRRRLPGKVLLSGDKVVGCGYYLIDRHRAVIGSFTLSEQARTSALVAILAKGLLDAVQGEPAVRRIETQFVPFDLPALREIFLAAGFREFERMFLRNEWMSGRNAPATRGEFRFESWSGSYTNRAAVLMQQAHQGSVDAEMNEMYRTREGCRSLLDSIIEQYGCGRLVPAASYVLRRFSEEALCGFLLTTEISTGHAHLAQVAVSPSAQGLGLGKLLLARALDALARAGYRSVSLMVSGTNQRALSLYESMGFRLVLDFPVFSWDRQHPRPR